MKVIGDKSHLLISVNKKALVNIGNNCIKSEDVHELLGITIESKLTSENRIDKFCKKVSQKLYAHARIYNYMAFDKRKGNDESFHYITVTALSCGYPTSKGYVKKALHERALKSHMGKKLPHLMNCWKRITLIQSIIKTSNFSNRNVQDIQ